MYTKLSSRKVDCFSCHFASLKYTTYGKRRGIRGLTKSTAEIISTRGCVWELNERESSFLFISGLSVWSSPSHPREEELHLWCLEGWLASLPPQGVSAGNDPESPVWQLTQGQGAMETCFSPEIFWGNNQIHPLVCKVGTGHRNSEWHSVFTPKDPDSLCFNQVH